MLGFSNIGCCCIYCVSLDFTTNLNSKPTKTLVFSREALVKMFLGPFLDMPGGQGLTGRVFQHRVGYGSGIGKNISGRIGYGLGTGIGIKYRANRVLSGIEKTSSGIFGYVFHVTYLLNGMSCMRLESDI